MSLTANEGDLQRRQLAEQLNRKHHQLANRWAVLSQHTPPCLVFGRYYAQSPVVYLSLNPPLLVGDEDPELRSTAGFNIPFRNSPELKRRYVYLKNCERFLEAHPRLRAFLEDGITAAFLVPWRTRTVTDLYRLNALCGGMLFTASQNFLCRLLRDHAASHLIVAGASGLRLLQDLKIAEEGILEKQEEVGEGGTYQWSRSRLLFEGRLLSVLQIPHFSRANSLGRLQPLATWLETHLAGFEIPSSFRDSPCKPNRT